MAGWFRNLVGWTIHDEPELEESQAIIGDGRRELSAREIRKLENLALRLEERREAEKQHKHRKWKAGV